MRDKLALTKENEALRTQLAEKEILRLKELEGLEADKAKLIGLLRDSNKAFMVNLPRSQFKDERVMHDAYQANAGALQKTQRKLT